MNGSLPPFTSIGMLKGQAKRLRAELAAEGEPITHSKSLELLAHRYGFKDWNTLHAAAGNGPPPCPVTLGSKVSGTYLGQVFEGDVIGVQTLTTPDRFRITLRFDQPVDVVRFNSFSNMRQRVSCIVDHAGKTIEKTSDGRPHMQLEI